MPETLSYTGSLVAQTVKHLPTMWETWVQSLGREDPLEKKWQPTPGFLPEKSQGRRSLVGSKGLQSWTGQSYFTFTFFHTASIIS